MFPVYLVVGLFNIWAQRGNYNIKLENENAMDIRVRRSVPESLIETEKRLKRTPNYFTDWFYKSGGTYNLDDGVLHNNNSDIDAATQRNTVAQNGYLSQYNDATNNNGYLQSGSKNNYSTFYGGNNSNTSRHNKTFSNNATYYPKYPIYFNITNYNTIPRYNYTIKLNNVTNNASYNTKNGNYIHNGYNSGRNRNQTVYNNGYNYASGYGYNGSGYGYNPFNVNNGTATRTTTERIVTGCIICNISCPKFLKRIGGLCLPDDDDY